MSSQQLKTFTILCTRYYHSRITCACTKRFILNIGRYAYRVEEADADEIKYEFYEYRVKSGVCVNDSQLNKIERLLLEILFPRTQRQERQPSPLLDRRIRPRQPREPREPREVRDPEPSEPRPRRRSRDREGSGSDVQFMDLVPLLFGINRFELRTPATEPRTVTKLLRGTEEYEQLKSKIKDKTATGFYIKRECWMIEPAIDDLLTNVKELVNPGMTSEEVQEIVDNILVRHVARENGDENLPPKAILPSLTEETCPIILKMDIERYKREFDEKYQANRIYAFKDNDQACWILEPYNSYVNEKIKPRTRPTMSQEEAQDLVNDIYANLLRKGQQYSDYKNRCNESDWTPPS